MQDIEAIKAEYVRMVMKAKKEDLSSFQMGFAAALGFVLGEDCPEVA